MLHIFLYIIGVYTAGYLITLILMCLGPDEEKARGIKQKAQWGVFFAIIWPFTLPIIIYTIPHSIITWINIWKTNKAKKHIPRPHHSMYSSMHSPHSPYYRQQPKNLYAKPIPSELIEDAFDGDDDDDD